MTDDIRTGREVDPIRRQIGQNVKAELIRMGFGQDKVAELLGVSQPQVSKRIAGTIGFEAAELARIAQLLQVPVDRLMGVPAGLLGDDLTSAGAA
jgi:transcriptional regulator with XRE-family HTH domain